MAAIATARALPRPALASIGAAWLVLAAIALTGAGAWIGHGHLVTGGVPVTEAVPAFLGGWVVMVVAMMLPVAPREHLGSPAFVAGFVWVWTAFGLAALTFDAGVHWSVAHWGWLARNAWIIQVALLASAGAYQVSPLKRRFLVRCLEPGRRTDLGAGWIAGANSVACCWALMLVGFAAGMGALGWMAGLAIAMVVEREGRHPERRAVLVGAVLVGLAVAGALGAGLLAPGSATGRILLPT